MSRTPHIFLSFLLLVSVLVVTGCQTYHLTTESLCQQFIDAKNQRHSLSDNFVPIGLLSALIFSGSVEGNDLGVVKCLDKDGKEVNIEVTNHTGVRITKKDGSRVTFYFNTLLIKDSTITGSKSHIFEARINPVILKNIAIIELQK
jgi:hypothetical protein